MKGDNNSYDDPWQLINSDVVGIAQIRIPAVGSLLRAPLVWTSVLLVAAALLIWPTRKRARGRRSVNVPDSSVQPDSLVQPESSEQSIELVHH
jgi:signal peptidase